MDQENRSRPRAATAPRSARTLAARAETNRSRRRGTGGQHADGGSTAGEATSPPRIRPPGRSYLERGTRAGCRWRRPALRSRRRSTGSHSACHSRPIEEQPHEPERQPDGSRRPSSRTSTSGYTTSQTAGPAAGPPGGEAGAGRLAVPMKQVDAASDPPARHEPTRAPAGTACGGAITSSTAPPSVLAVNTAEGPTKRRDVIVAGTAAGPGVSRRASGGTSITPGRAAASAPRSNLDVPFDALDDDPTVPRAQDRPPRWWNSHEAGDEGVGGHAVRLVRRADLLQPAPRITATRSPNSKASSCSWVTRSVVMPTRGSPRGSRAGSARAG